MVAFARTVGGLMVKPAMLVFVVVMFAAEFALYLPELIRFADFELWAVAGLFLYGVTMIWLAWWTPRQLAGDATGQGHFWKWLGYSLGLGLASGLPILIAGLVAGFGQDNPMIGWSAGAASAVLQIALLLVWVRVDAVAISGDRISYSQIRQGLTGQVAKVLLFFAPSITISWAAYVASADSDLINTVDAFALAAMAAAAQSLAGSVMTATLVAAYLLVDQSTYVDSARDTFA